MVAKRETTQAAPNASTGAAGSVGNETNTAGWSAEQVGFDPYWTPDTGKKIVGMLMNRDDKDPTFVRFQFIAANTTKCQRGPADMDSERHEEVTVAPGETFNISKYDALEPLLTEYLLYSSDTGNGVLVEISCGIKVKTKTPGREVWQWKASVPPEVKKALNSWRLQHKSRLMPAGAPQREQLQETNAAQ